jgi:hypothetical protein
VTYQNECFAATAGVTVASVGECAEACGGAAGITCTQSRFCQRAEGVCAEEAEGVCTEKPATCETIPNPVCGCDGHTYTNACFAAGAGVTVASPGECPPVVACGGAAGDTCTESQFCQHDAGVCAEDTEGVCTEKAGECPTVLNPVCGCDGNTYDNACLAAAAGVTVASQGECTAGVACGGAAGDTCTESQFCQRDAGVCAEVTEGVCTEKPEECPTVQNLVCGCDGNTYGNECLAAASGVTVASVGECTSVACGGAAGDTCTESQFCKHAGVCTEDAEGVCTNKPLACTTEYNPVCGCDGNTYTNPCYAAGAGVNVAPPGECSP